MSSVSCAQSITRTSKICLRINSSALAPLLAVKGSIAVEGISLTVTEAHADHFAVAVIPHSFAVTKAD